jgi:hypothetical protein
MKNILFSKFSFEAQKILLSNNITGEEIIDWSELEQSLNCSGYLILDVMKDFFSMCAYSEIYFPYDPESNIYGKLVIDPRGYIDPLDRIDLETYFNLNLSLLGYLGWGGEVMIDDNENIYLFEDGNLALLGQSLISGIEEIFKGKNWRLNP